MQTQTQSSSAIRVQRFRKRQRSGCALFSIEANEAALIDKLIDAGILHPADADDHKAVEKALERAVLILIEKGYNYEIIP
jgi:hypothetical protein